MQTLELETRGKEYWDDEKEEFVYTDGRTLIFEHSLATIAEWESIYHKPFLSNKKLSNSELVSYISTMCHSKLTADDISSLSSEDIDEIQRYIENPSTATWFSDKGKSQGNSSQIVTSELIYYWMIQLGIPMECEHWHLNRLLVLIRVCNEKNKTPKKMSRSEIFAHNSALNKKRRAMYKTRG